MCACSFMLNSVQDPHVATVHPWVLSTSNQRRTDDQLRAVDVPDTPAATILKQGGHRGTIGMMTGTQRPCCAY